jgi:hypothetical protein
LIGHVNTPLLMARMAKPPARPPVRTRRPLANISSLSVRPTSSKLSKPRLVNTNHIYSGEGTRQGLFASTARSEIRSEKRRLVALSDLDDTFGAWCPGSDFLDPAGESEFQNCWNGENEETVDRHTRESDDDETEDNEGKRKWYESTVGPILHRFVLFTNSRRTLWPNGDVHINKHFFTNCSGWMVWVTTSTTPIASPVS